MIYADGFNEEDLQADQEYQVISFENSCEQVAFQSNANHPLAESTGYIKFEGM